MLKQSIQSLSVLAIIMSMHSAASATCVGDTCAVDINADVKFTSHYNLDPDHNGIFIQSNYGSNKAEVKLNNVVMRENGDITGNAQAIGNNIGVTLALGSTVPLKHVSQSNYGNQTSTVVLNQSAHSKTGEVLLEAISVGNNFSLSLDNTSLAELSVAQCNVGNNTATVSYNWDPTKLTASATSVGNNVSISALRP
jgi:hypothetical protein